MDIIYYSATLVGLSVNISVNLPLVNIENLLIYYTNSQTYT